MDILDTALASTVEETINWAGLPWWAWLLIFLLVVLFLWWRLAVSSKEMEMQAQELAGHNDQHGHHQPDEQGAVEPAEIEGDSGPEADEQNALDDQLSGEKEKETNPD